MCFPLPFTFPQKEGVCDTIVCLMTSFFCRAPPHKIAQKQQHKKQQKKNQQKYFVCLPIAPCQWPSPSVPLFRPLPLSVQCCRLAGFSLTLLSRPVLALGTSRQKPPVGPRPRALSVDRKASSATVTLHLIQMPPPPGQNLSGLQNGLCKMHTNSLWLDAGLFFANRTIKTP